MLLYHRSTRINPSLIIPFGTLNCPQNITSVKSQGKSPHDSSHTVILPLYARVSRIKKQTVHQQRSQSTCRLTIIKISSPGHQRQNSCQPRLFLTLMTQIIHSLNIQAVQIHITRITGRHNTKLLCRCSLLQKTQKRQPFKHRVPIKNAFIDGINPI